MSAPATSSSGNLGNCGAYTSDYCLSHQIHESEHPGDDGGEGDFPYEAHSQLLYS